MSIQDLFHRIKARLPSRAGEPGNVEIVEFGLDGKTASHTLLDKFFLSLIILLVAIGSFGLGKLSGGGERPPIEIRYENLDEENNLKPGQTASTVGLIQPGTTQVAASKNGSKYHYLYCPGAKQIKEDNKIIFASALAAESAGYTLAGNCSPR